MSWQEENSLKTLENLDCLLNGLRAVVASNVVQRQLEEDNERLKAENQQLKGENQQLKTEIFQTIQNNKFLRSELETLRAQTGFLALADEIYRLNNQLFLLKGENSSLWSRPWNQKTSDTLKQIVKGKNLDTDVMTKLQQENDRKDRQIASYKRVISFCNSEQVAEDLKEIVENFRGLNTKFSETKIEVDQLTHNNQLLTEKLKDAKAQIDQCEKDKEALDNSVHRFKELLKKAEIEKDLLKYENLELGKSNAMIHGLLQQKEEDYQLSKAECQFERDAVENLTTKLMTLQNEFAKISEEKGRISSKLSSVLNTLQTLTLEISEAKEEEKEEEEEEKEEDDDEYAL